MNEEANPQPIDPELEARIVAFVLGEASDFECEQLETLINARPELAEFKEQITLTHVVLGEVGDGDPLDTETAEDWKLPDERREHLISVLSGNTNAAIAFASPSSLSSPRWKANPSWWKFAKVAAVLLVCVSASATFLLPSRRLAMVASSRLPDNEATVRSEPDETTAIRGKMANLNYYTKEAAVDSNDDFKAAFESDQAAIDSKGLLSDIRDSDTFLNKTTKEDLGEARPTLQVPVTDSVTESYIVQVPKSGSLRQAPSSNAKAVPAPVADKATTRMFRSESGPQDEFHPEIRSGGRANVAAPELPDLLLRRETTVVPNDTAVPTNDGFARWGRSSWLSTSNSEMGSGIEQKDPSSAISPEGQSLQRGTGSYSSLTVPDLDRSQIQFEAGSQQGPSDQSIQADTDFALEGNSSGTGMGPAMGMGGGGIAAAPSPDSARPRNSDSLFFDDFGLDSQPASAPEPADVVKRHREFESKSKMKKLLADAEAEAEAEAEDNSVAKKMPKTRKLSIGQQNAEARQPALNFFGAEQEWFERELPSSPQALRMLGENQGHEAANGLGMEGGGPASDRAAFDEHWSDRAKDSLKQLAELNRYRTNLYEQEVRKGDSSRHDVSGKKFSSTIEADDKDVASDPQVDHGRESVWLDDVPPATVELRGVKPAPVTNTTAQGLNETSAAEESFSTFSLHVSDVSFKLAQSALSRGEWPDAGKIRIEEFVNAFDYGDPMPARHEKVACQVEQSVHPFLQQRNLLRVSIRTAAAGRASQTPLRLTFLLDNSGSMERVDRQETVRRAFSALAQQLRPTDQVTLISFARQPRLIADRVSGSNANDLSQMIDALPSEGGTNLEAALKLAFEKAQEQQQTEQPQGNTQNRIILLTDGAVNLGNANPESLSNLITTMRDAGIAFDAAGISAEGLNDEVLEALTRQGDGRYYLLDSAETVDEGFAKQIAGALRPSAKNVKVQIEFNPKRVGRYKLLGFEKHRLEKDDFRNDAVDAAEMAAAEAGVALYHFEAKPDGEGDVGTVFVRFRDLSSDRMIEHSWPIPYQPETPRVDRAAPSMRIATSAALLASRLRGEPLGEVVDLKVLASLVSGLPELDRNSKRVGQLKQMIEQARQLSGD